MLGVPVRPPIAIAGLALAAAMGWWGWQAWRPVPAATSAPVSTPFVQVRTGTDPVKGDLLRERAEFFDPTPLFVPTDKNFGQTLPDRLRRQPGQVFGLYDPKPSFAESSLPPFGKESNPVPETVPEILGQSNEAPFPGFGVAAPLEPQLPRRSAALNVKSLTGEGLEFPLIPIERAPPKEDYLPVEFIVLVGEAGMVGKPVITSASGSSAVDDFFRDFITRDYRLGERLPPGRYRVVGGP